MAPRITTNPFFPGTCVLCNLPSERTKDLCQHCETSLPWTKISPENITALFHYQEPVDHLITALKFSNKLIYAKILGELMADKLQQKYKRQNLPELMIPVPLHKKRLCTRGFNQAVELAKPIAKRLNIPIDLTSCQRIKNTETQSLIPAKKRQQNVKNAFKLKKKLNVKHVAIIDDVVTTGHTTQELSKILKRAGVQQIDIWCCAKTSLS